MEAVRISICRQGRVVGGTGGECVSVTHTDTGPGILSSHLRGPWHRGAQFLHLSTAANLMFRPKSPQPGAVSGWLPDVSLAPGEPQSGSTAQ